MIGATLLCAWVLGCGGEAAPTARPAPAARSEPMYGPVALVQRGPQEEPPPPVDPATFVATEITGVPTLANHTIHVPPAASVEPDGLAPGAGAPMGVTIKTRGFELHVWRGTIAGERSALLTRSRQEGLEFSETVSTADRLEYSLARGGQTGFGLIQSSFDAPAEGPILCGNVWPVREPAALVAYARACASLTRS